MRVVFTTTLPMQTGGDYEFGSAVIRLNLNMKKKLPDFWKRYLVAVFVHEFTHHVLSYFMPRENPMDFYRQEIICYRVQWVAEALLMIPHVVSVEEGAIASVMNIIRAMKESVVKWNPKQ